MYTFSFWPYLVYIETIQACSYFSVFLHVAHFLSKYLSLSWKALFNKGPACYQCPDLEASILGGGGGGGGGSCPPMKILGGKHCFRFAPPPPPIILTTWKSIICLKSTARHYETIKFNIKILSNIYNFQFCGALRAKFYIKRAKNFELFLTFAPPPPIRKTDRRPCQCLK